MRDLLLSILVPPACAICRRPLRDAGAVACAGCLRRLPWLRGHRCPRCALPRHRSGCPASGASFDRAWAPLAYEGAARDLVAALKFRAALPAAGLMAAHVAANLPADVRRGTWAAPRRADVRGPPPHDASLAVVPVPAHRGRRRRRGFDAAALLVDDVHTTGATLDACARALKEGGAEAVAAVTYARTL